MLSNFEWLLSRSLIALLHSSRFFFVNERTKNDLMVVIDWQYFGAASDNAVIYERVLRDTHLSSWLVFFFEDTCVIYGRVYQLSC